MRTDSKIAQLKAIQRVPKDMASGAQGSRTPAMTCYSNGTADMEYVCSDTSKPSTRRQGTRTKRAGTSELEPPRTPRPEPPLQCSLFTVALCSLGYPRRSIKRSTGREMFEHSPLTASIVVLRGLQMRLDTPPVAFFLLPGHIYIMSVCITSRVFETHFTTREPGLEL